MSNGLFRAAAVICLFALMAHEMLGGPLVLPPLSEAQIEEEVVWLHHFSWHVGSVSVTAMAVMFFWASIRPGNLALAVVATFMSIGFGLLGAGLALFASSTLWGTPAPYLWSLIAVVGGLGIWTSLAKNGAQ